MALGRQKRGRHHVTFLTIVGAAIACAVCCLTGCASAAECFGGTEAEGRAVCVGDEHGVWYADNETVRLAHPHLFVCGLDRSSAMVGCLSQCPRGAACFGQRAWCNRSPPSTSLVRHPSLSVHVDRVQCVVVLFARRQNTRAIRQSAVREAHSHVLVYQSTLTFPSQRSAAKSPTALHQHPATALTYSLASTAALYQCSA
jgi:hypothetical protein